MVYNPSFFGILNAVTDNGTKMCVEGDTNCDDITSSFYSSATYIIIAMAALVVITAFFGCCCMLKTYFIRRKKHFAFYFHSLNICTKNNQNQKFTSKKYFIIVLVLYIGMLTGVILGYTTVNFEGTIKTHLQKALQQYDDTPAENDTTAQNYNVFWNEMQAQVKALIFFSCKGVSYCTRCCVILYTLLVAVLKKTMYGFFRWVQQSTQFCTNEL